MMVYMVRTEGFTAVNDTLRRFIRDDDVTESEELYHGTRNANPTFDIR